MTRNLRGAYCTFAHDRQADWDFLRAWQPNVIRLMLPASHSDPASLDANRIRRVHETCPEATLLLRVWDVDDRNYEAHAAMVSNPHAEAAKQLDWWARAFDRIADVPRSLLMAGLNNETGPEKDGALYPYTERALELGIQRGVRLGVFVFSVGRPSLPGEAQYDMTYFSRLEAAILANRGAAVLHEYMQPEGMYAVWTDNQGNERKDYTYLIGRHTRWPMNVPIIIGEWGVDGLLYNRHPHPDYGNSGWRHFRDLWHGARFADEYVECVRQASDNVIGICPFLSDFADRKWASFDLLDAYPEFVARKERMVPQAAPQPVTVHLPTVGTGPEPAPAIAYVNAPAGLNLRAAPKDGAILVAIPFAEQIRITGVGQDGWVKVRYGQHEGYAAARYISLEAPAPLPQPEPQDNWARSLAFVRRWEGGWSDNPNDKGGATNKGITLATYTRWRKAQGQSEPTKDDLRSLSDAEANRIYYEWYWLASGANKLSWPLCLIHFDTAVNAGTGRAQEMLERSNGLFLAYAGHLIDWYTRIDDFEHFGRAWIRRRAEILLEAAK